ncbi:MAG: urease accessory protein UreF [Acetobacteraceae bacterium]|nr:urease accessory protein UreF [Acetobacteraceae bacterium]
MADEWPGQARPHGPPSTTFLSSQSRGSRPFARNDESAYRQLRLLAWLSPGFPIGAYAYSHGLEWAVEAGDITSSDSLHEWIASVLLHGTGRNDAILLRHAYRAAHDLEALRTVAELAAAATPSRERREETLSQGAAFARAVRAWSCPDLPEPIAYPVAVGALAGWHGISEGGTVAAYLQTFAANLISAAVRLVPLGQTDGLHVLAELEPVVLGLVDNTRDTMLDDLGGCAFRSDLAAMRHETQYTRLFRS